MQLALVRFLTVHVVIVAIQCILCWIRISFSICVHARGRLVLHGGLISDRTRQSRQLNVVITLRLLLIPDTDARCSSLGNIAWCEIEAPYVDLLVLHIHFTSLVVHLQVVKFERHAFLALAIFSTITSLLPTALLLLFASQTLAFVCTFLHSVDHLI